MKLILVTGMPGSGKEELLRMADSKGISYLRMGDTVRECYKGSDAYRKGFNVVEYADNERKAFGDGIWAKRTL